MSEREILVDSNGCLTPNTPENRAKKGAEFWTLTPAGHPKAKRPASDEIVDAEVIKEPVPVKKPAAKKPAAKKKPATKPAPKTEPVSLEDMDAMLDAL